MPNAGWNSDSLHDLCRLAFCDGSSGDSRGQCHAELRRWGKQFFQLAASSKFNVQIRLALETLQSSDWLSAEEEACARHASYWVRDVFRPAERSDPVKLELIELATSVYSEMLAWAQQRHPNLHLKLLLIGARKGDNETPTLSMLNAHRQFVPTFWRACTEDPWCGAETLTWLYLEGNATSDYLCFRELHAELMPTFSKQYPDLGERVKRMEDFGPARLHYR